MSNSLGEKGSAWCGGKGVSLVLTIYFSGSHMRQNGGNRAVESRRPEKILNSRLPRFLRKPALVTLAKLTSVNVIGARSRAGWVVLSG